MKKTLTTTLAIAMAATMTQAQDNNDTVSSGNWTNAAIWDLGVPTTAHKARLKNDVTLDSSAPDVDQLETGRGNASTLTIEAGGQITSTNRITVGGNNDGYIIMNGGSLITESQLNISTKPGFTDSTVTVNDGLLTVDNNLTIGAQDKGTFTLNGGAATVGSLSLEFGSTLNLYGGILAVATNSVAVLDLKSSSDILNIQNDGRMELGGDQLDNLDTLIASNSIAWANGSSTLGSTYGIGDQTWDNGSGSYLHAALDGSETIVWTDAVIPEPATLGMVLMSGMGILFIRRRLRL